MVKKNKNYGVLKHALMNVFDGAFEPISTTPEPGEESAEEHSPDGNRGVVEVILGDRIRHGQREEDGDHRDPENCSPADGSAVPTEMEGAADERLAPQRHLEEDRQSVGDVGNDRRDRRHRLERDGAAQRLHKSICWRKRIDVHVACCMHEI